MAELGEFRALDSIARDLRATAGGSARRWRDRWQRCNDLRSQQATQRRSRLRRKVAWRGSARYRRNCQPGQCRMAPTRRDAASSRARTNRRGSAIRRRGSPPTAQTGASPACCCGRACAGLRRSGRCMDGPRQCPSRRGEAAEARAVSGVCASHRRGLAVERWLQTGGGFAGPACHRGDGAGLPHVEPERTCGASRAVRARVAAAAGDSDGAVRSVDRAVMALANGYGTTHRLTLEARMQDSLTH